MTKHLLTKYDAGRASLFLNALTKLGRKHGFKLVGDVGIEAMVQADINPLYAFYQDQETGDYRTTFYPAPAGAKVVDALNRAGSELVCRDCLDNRMVENPAMCPTVPVVAETICADCEHPFRGW